jgi:hypothetical protein
LAAVLARMLEGKSYVLTFGDGADGSPRVKALHVLGPSGPYRRERPAAETTGAPPAPFAVPVHLLVAAFDPTETDHRKLAIRELLEYVRGNPEHRSAFLAADTDTMLVTLRRYPAASTVLRQMMSAAAGDDATRGKLNALLTGLE